MKSLPNKPQIQDWSFNVEEVSAGVYKVSGTDPDGHNVELIGTDPDKLLEECKVQVKTMINCPSS